MQDFLVLKMGQCFGLLTDIKKSLRNVKHLSGILSMRSVILDQKKNILLLLGSRKVEKSENKNEKKWFLFVKLRFFDVFEVLEAHTRGVKIFSYIFCIFSHPQMVKKALKKNFVFEKYRIVLGSISGKFGSIRVTNGWPPYGLKQF